MLCGPTRHAAVSHASQNNAVPGQRQISQRTQGAQTTIAVTPFTPRAGEQQAWLSKGLADLLIRDLAEVQSLVVVTREQTQVFAREVQLQDSALFSQEKALRLGRVAKVDGVIYGNYTVAGDQITISIFLLDMQTQQVIQKEETSGPLNDLRALVRTLVFHFVERQGIELSETERTKIQLEATDSISATKHFYRAIDFYDQGRHADAFGEFYAAFRQDPAYREARLWMGKMFESLGQYEHAVVTYRKLYREAPTAVEGLDALYLSGRVLESQLARHSEAIEAYRTLAGIRPHTPHVLEAAFRLGMLLERQGRDAEAYDAFGMVDAFRERIERNRSLLFRSRIRASRFLTWPHALQLYQDAIVRMVSLYQRISQQADEDKRPSPPRGVFVVNAEDPAIREPIGRTPSLFHRTNERPNWREKYYAVIVPKGYVATGVDMTVAGRVMTRHPYNSYAMRVLDFPLPRDFFNHWLGTIYGQTPHVATLKKTISFHGEHRRIFTIQLIEGHAYIERWGVRVRIRPEIDMQASRPITPVPEEDNEFWEGRPVGRIGLPGRTFSGSTRPSSESFYGPQKELALAADRRGTLFVVAVEGELDGEQTDLWWSQSRDGTNWPELALLPINSASEDYNPHLVRAEDGTMWLFWISTRRGLGWELWASSSREGQTWSNPHRIPLERFVETPATQRPQPAIQVLEYDVIQDRRGRWLVVFYSRDTRETIIIRSTNGLAWTLLARVPTKKPLYGPSLVEDGGGVLWMAALGQGGKVHLWSSKEGTVWTPKAFGSGDFPYPRAPTVHRTRLFSLPDGHLLLLVSDTTFGLQYARFRPHAGKPKFDLVSWASLEAFAAAALPTRGYLVALKQNDEILLRRYQKFNTTGTDVEKDERNWQIYVEQEHDVLGNRWHRITARARVIIPDVTSVGVDPWGRVWWGIESGIMAKRGDQFFATDVSQGFFYHYVSHIKGCGRSVVWFGAKQLDRPVVGFARPFLGLPTDWIRPEFRTRVIPGVAGAITAIQCGGKAGQVYFGTSQGDVVGLDRNQVVFRRSLAQAPHVTALAVDPAAGVIWVGTREQGLYQLQKNSQRHFSNASGLPAQEVTALTLDADGALWVALNGKGLRRYHGGRWSSFTPDNSQILYASIGRVEADPVKGVWYIAHPETRSRGLGYFDGTTGRVYNPPHRILDRPSSLAVDPNGHVWVGTWFDGLYDLEPMWTEP
ncbi:MAG: exo-alpha-sialidase [Candidatus Methylomirabilales bacterium]